MTRIPVELPAPDAGRYDVLIEAGSVGRLPELVGDVVAATRFAVLADGNVAALFGAELVERLRAAGRSVDLFEFPAGEAHKTRETWAALTDRMLAAGFGRDTCVIALGGGVTGDLAGFVAATYMRGLPFVQVPTTLLAMVDASVGGKTGVDTPAGKNLVGAFHQPRLVVADPEVLGTLPLDELRSGLAEAVKHGAIADARYLDAMEADAARLLAREPAALAALIERSVEIKTDVVGRDPLETGERQALNFGHTIGHALELVTGYRTLHGHCVAIGMVVEADAGERAGMTEAGTADRLEAALRAFGLPARLHAGTAPADILRACTLDKKARGGRVHYTLIEWPGRLARDDAGRCVFPLDPDIVLAALHARSTPPT